MDSIWVFPKNNGTPRWMMKIMENPMNKWMVWGVFPLFVVQHPSTVQDSFLLNFQPICRSTDSMGRICHIHIIPTEFTYRCGAIVLSFVNLNVGLSTSTGSMHHRKPTCLENTGKYNFFLKQLWLVLGIKFMEIISNLFSRWNLK